MPRKVDQNETPEERKERYLKSKQEKEASQRKKRKEEVENNTTTDRRLSFMTNIFDALGYNKNKIAKLCGTTQQAMSWYFSVVDDCRLSQAEEFLRAIGLDLKVSINRDGKTPRQVLPDVKKTGQNNGVKFTINGDVAKNIKWINPKMPAYVNACTPDKRLYFLATYLPSVGLPITELMQKCNIDMSSLRYYFTSDDIKISKLFDIARATGGDIIWTVNNRPNNS